MPRSATRDVRKWEIGLDGKPADPWQHFMCLVLQLRDTHELFTFATSSRHRTPSVGNLLRHYDRMREKARRSCTPSSGSNGGYNHRDERVGWVHTPVFAVVGKRAKASAAIPDTSPVATSTTPFRSEERSREMPHATPLPIAEKAKAAIARQEAIERKCAQAIEHFDLDSSPEGEQAAIAVAKDIVAAFAIANVRVSLSEIRDRIRLILKEREEGD